MLRLRFLLIPLSLFACLTSYGAAAADPCAGDAPRALVLGSGGSKGAFEAGAIYHLVVHRGCDFTEISGNSVGALNAAILAQATRSPDHEQSLANLRAAAENLIAEWDAIHSRRDMMRTRPLAKLRFAFVGLDSIEDFSALREFVRTRVTLPKLAAGRELRVGALSFTDGRYREFLLNRDGVADPSTHDFIFASALVPVFSRMPVLTPQGGGTPAQFGDGGIRHATPVTSYFTRCGERGCVSLAGAHMPPHPRVEQLYVIVTSPYTPGDDTKPISNPDIVDPRTGTIDDGRKILVRMFGLMIDTLHREDLDDMLMYNDVLRWQSRLTGTLPATPSPLGSFNRTAPGAASQPYEIALIAPEREDSDPLSIFEAAPKHQRERVYCGCVAADKVMTAQFGQPPMADRCATRFMPMPARRRAADSDEPLTPAICRDEPLAVPAR